MANSKKATSKEVTEESAKTKDQESASTDRGSVSDRVTPSIPSSLFGGSDSKNDDSSEVVEDPTMEGVTESKDKEESLKKPKAASAKTKKERKKEKGDLVKKTKKTLETVRRRGRGRPKKSDADEEIISQSEIAVEMLKKKSLGINFSRLKQDKVAFDDPTNGVKSSFTIFSSLRYAVIDKAGSVEAGDAILRHFAVLANRKHPSEGLTSAIVREAALLFVMSDDLAEKYRDGTPRGIHNTPPK